MEADGSKSDGKREALNGVRVNMDLSPNDIRNYEFTGQLRGYNKDTVDDFKEQAAVALESARQQNLRLSMEIESLKSQLSGLKQFEETIKSAAIDARRNADMTVSNAKQEAKLILSKAKVEAEKAIEARAYKISRIEDQITKLELARNSYMTKLKGLLTSHLELVQEIARSEQAKRSEDESLEIIDSSEVKDKARETIATQPSQPEAVRTEEAQVPAEVAEPVEPPPETQDITPHGEAAKEVPPGIDPELASALEKYQKSAQAEPPDTPLAAETKTPPPKPGEVVETTARAEDIPEGFIDKVDIAGADTSDTDRVAMAPEAQDQPTEHNAIDASDSPPQRESASPENLAKSLDEVAAKFEEEMDKAAKN